MANVPTKRLRCQATVWKRDTYRHTGRGKSGFSMHYDKCQCERPARFDNCCWQHKNKKQFQIESNFYKDM